MMDAKAKPVNLRRAISKKGVDSADKTARTKQTKASSPIEKRGQHDDKVRTKCGQKESEAAGLILRVRDKSITQSNKPSSSDPSVSDLVLRVAEPGSAHVSALQQNGFHALKSSRPLSTDPARVARPLGMFPLDRGGVFALKGSPLAPLPPDIEESERIEYENRVLGEAAAIATRRIGEPSHVNSPWVALSFAYAISGYDVEVFAVIFLDANRVPLHNFPIVMNVGAISFTDVQPREVARAALAWNASAVVVAHNHPSGTCVPSENDVLLTLVLRDTLRVVGVELLDHAVVGAGGTFLIAEAEPISSLMMKHFGKIQTKARAYMWGDERRASQPTPEKAKTSKRRKPRLTVVSAP